MKEMLERFVSPTGRQVRVAVRDGEPWFVAKDVCDILGTRTDNVRKIVGDKRVATICPYSVGENGRGHGGEMLLVSEAGLYKLVLVSRKKEAIAFQDWVTDEVLPSIRKHGAYMTSETARRTVEHPEDAIALAKALLEEHERRQIAESQRDKAIREKSWIGSQREASAMSAASKQYRKVRRLETELEVARKDLEDMLPDAEAHRSWRKAYEDGMRKYWHDLDDPEQTRLFDERT